MQTEDAHNFAEWCSRPCASPAEKIAKPGERLVITAGVPFGTPGATNVLQDRLGGGRRSALIGFSVTRD